MKLMFTLPTGEIVAADPCQLALRNNPDATAIELIVTRPNLEPLIVAVYSGAYLATNIASIPPVPELRATLSPVEV